MGCRELQLNQYFQFIEPENTPQNGFRFVGKQCSLGFQPENISYSYNDNDQLLTEISTVDGTINYTYDDNGSLISKINQSQNESYSYTYNLQNRSASATITRIEVDQTGISKLVEITANYVYNQSGIRVASNTSTTIDGGTPTVKNTTYLIDPSNFTGYAQVLEESTNGTLTKSYTLGDDISSQSSVISDQLSVSHLLYDGHGSTRLLTSDTSTITARYNYDAYGKNLFSANVTAHASTDMLYSGEQFDPNLQMQYLRARYYDPNNGRFNRLDPFGGKNQDPQSLHKYAYTHCNPVMGIDPSGEYSMLEFLTVGTISILAGVFNGITSSIIGEKGKGWKNFLGGFLSGTLGTALTLTLLVWGCPPPVGFAIGSMLGQIITEWGAGTLTTKTGLTKVLVATIVGGILGFFLGDLARTGLLNIGTQISKALANLSTKTFIELSKLAFKIFIGDLIPNYKSFLSLTFPQLLVNMTSNLAIAAKRMVKKKREKESKLLKQLNIELEEVR